MTLKDLYDEYHAAVARAEEARALFFAALLDARQSRTFEDIGRELNLTRQRVQKIEKQAQPYSADSTSGVGSTAGATGS